MLFVSDFCLGGPTYHINFITSLIRAMNPCVQLVEQLSIKYFLKVLHLPVASDTELTQDHVCEWPIFSLKTFKFGNIRMFNKNTNEFIQLSFSYKYHLMNFNFSLLESSPNRVTDTELTQDHRPMCEWPISYFSTVDLSGECMVIHDCRITTRINVNDHLIIMFLALYWYQIIYHRAYCLVI